MAPKGAAYQRKHLLDLPTPEDSLDSVSAYDRHELGMELAGGRIDSEEIWLDRCKAKPAKGGLSRSISVRSEEHTSELQSLMRISYAVFCLKKKITTDKETAYITFVHESNV